MYEKLSFHIRGISPLMLHNGQLANPMNEFAKAMKVVSGKRKKTDADYAELSRLEFLGGLYVDEKGAPAIPGENIEAMIVKAAKSSKMGQNAKAGIICDGTFPIIYEGPSSGDALFKSGKFVDMRKVKVQTSSVIRTRPLFRNWELKFAVEFLPDQLNAAQVREFVETAGRSVALGDFRPKFGRFEVV